MSTRATAVGRPTPVYGHVISADAVGDCPASLFLKMVSTNLGDEESFGDSEVGDYTRDYTDVPDAPLLRCHDAAYSEHRKALPFLLLDDPPRPTSRRPRVSPPWNTRLRWPMASRPCTPVCGAPTTG